MASKEINCDIRIKTVPGSKLYNVALIFESVGEILMCDH